MMINEIRKTPELNPKISAYEALKKYKDNPNIFISFTEVEKIGINPRYKFNNPIGIYAYPLKEIWEKYNLNKEKSFKKIPFASKRPFIWILKSKDNFIHDLFTQYKKNNFEKDVKKLEEIFGNIDKLVQKAKDEAYADNYPSYLWRLTELLSHKSSKKTSTEWNSIFRKLGYSGFADKSGKGIIHRLQPIQAIFFSKAGFEVIDKILNKDYKEDKQLNLFVKKAKSFKKELTEEFYKIIKHKPLYASRQEKLNIFKNPSSREIKKENLQGRGILLKNGDLFMVSGNIIHEDLINIFKLPVSRRWHIDPDSLNSYLCVITKNYKTFYLAESYFIKEIKLFKKYIKIMKKKNPSLKLLLKKEFSATSIDESLKNLKNELTEEFYKGKMFRSLYSKKAEYEEIFKNPSEKELNEISETSLGQIRGILFENGDFFVSKGNRLIHNHILEIIGIKTFDWHKKPNLLNKFICLASLKNKPKIFHLSESYFQPFIKENNDKMQEYIKIMKKKNSNLTFSFKRVREIEKEQLL